MACSDNQLDPAAMRGMGMYQRQACQCIVPPLCSAVAESTARHCLTIITLAVLTTDSVRSAKIGCRSQIVLAVDHFGVFGCVHDFRCSIVRYTRLAASATVVKLSGLGCLIDYSPVPMLWQALNLLLHSHSTVAL
jgi:hypothetical protein